MNDIYFCKSVLAHGLQMSASSGIYLLIVLAFFIFGLFVYRKDARIPKGLFVSSIIPYILVLISILQFSFDLQVPDVIGYICFAAGFYPNFLIDGAFGMGAGFFLAAFIIDTLVIFAIVRLILFIKHKVSAKKPQDEQTV
jgi:uncharacterized membrane protein